jgi:hypothetical protein
MMTLCANEIRLLMRLCGVVNQVVDEYVHH